MNEFYFISFEIKNHFQPMAILLNKDGVVADCRHCALANMSRYRRGLARALNFVVFVSTFFPSIIFERSLEIAITLSSKMMVFWRLFSLKLLSKCGESRRLFP